MQPDDDTDPDFLRAIAESKRELEEAASAQPNKASSTAAAASLPTSVPGSRPDEPPSRMQRLKKRYPLENENDDAAWIASHTAVNWRVLCHSRALTRGPAKWVVWYVRLSSWNCVSCLDSRYFRPL